MNWTRSSAEASDGRPRIAVVAHRVDDSGGMERAHSELVRRLLDRYCFTIVASNIADDLRERVDWLRVPLPPRSAPLRFLVFYGLGAIQLRRVRADLIHVCGALVPNRADVANVQFCHAGFGAPSRQRAAVRSSLARRLNTSIDSRLAVEAERWAYRRGQLRLFAPASHLVAEELGETYPGVAVEETPNGVDLERFRPNPVTRRAVRSELNTDDRTTVALFVGGDWDRKGLSLAIDALAVARSGGASAELWVLGSGDERRFKTQAETAGVAGVVRFLGRRPDTERYYQAADVYLSCSSYEAFSLALLEAAASALPLVVTRVGGVAELLGGTDEPSGVVVARQAEEIGAALGELPRDPVSRARNGDAARRRAEEFGWDRFAERFDAIYRRLLKEFRQ